MIRTKGTGTVGLCRVTREHNCLRPCHPGQLQSEDGEVRYYADCVAMDASDQAMQTQVVSAPVASSKKRSPMLEDKAPASSAKKRSTAAMKKSLNAEKPLGDASEGVVSPVAKTPQAAPKPRRVAKPRTPKV